MRCPALVAVAALTFLASCGGGDDEAAETSTTTTTTEAPEEERTLYLRFVAAMSGLSGCSVSTDRASIDVGNGARVQVSASDGTILGTGTMALTGGAELCDWTVLFSDVPAERDFYVIEAGGEAATLSNDELTGMGFQVQFDISVLGDVRVARVP